MMLIALPFLVLFYQHDSLWLAYSGMIPGAVAIRAVGRVVLFMLVPAALGLACLVEFLDQRRWAIAGWIVALVCLSEQGMTTPSFDAATNRAAIEGLAAGLTEVGSRFIIVRSMVCHSFAITWMRCGRRSQAECRRLTGIRDIRPDHGIASSKPTAIQKLTWRAPWPSGSERTDCYRITFSGSAWIARDRPIR